MSAAEPVGEKIQVVPLLLVNKRSRMTIGHYVEHRLVGGRLVSVAKTTDCGIRLGSRWALISNRHHAKWFGDRGLVLCESCVACRLPLWEESWRLLLAGKEDPNRSLSDVETEALVAPTARIDEEQTP